MLEAAGVTPESVTVDDVPAVVGTFGRFAAIPAEDAAPPDEDGDGVLAQFGTYSFRGLREFSADLTRQFAERGDDDAPIWQLSCTFHWEPTAETDALESGNQWSFGMSLEEFLSQAVTLPGWAWALASPPPPRDLTITLCQV
jgi:hypothetical protein